jgi:HmuY protein
MKTLFRIYALSFSCLLLVLTSCDDDSDDPKITPLSATEVNDLDAISTSNYTLFNFEKGGTVSNADSASNAWDIGFRGTTLIVNSGVSGPGAAEAQLVDGIFEELLVAPATGYLRDTDAGKAIGSGGWYTYTGTTSVPNHAVLPNAGKILVIKTASGKFVKMEILSYYQGNPSTSTAEFADLTIRPASRYYSFRYLYQPDGTTNLEATE